MSDTRKRKTYPVKPEKGWALAWATDASGRPGTGFVCLPVVKWRRVGWLEWIRIHRGDEVADLALRLDAREAYRYHRQQLYRQGCRVIRVEVRPLEGVRV